MIYSETIETIYSRVIINPIYSSEDMDFRILNIIRITENEQVRITEDNNTRTLES